MTTFKNVRKGLDVTGLINSYQSVEKSSATHEVVRDNIFNRIYGIVINAILQPVSARIIARISTNTDAITNARVNETIVALQEAHTKLDNLRREMGSLKTELLREPHLESGPSTASQTQALARRSPLDNKVILLGAGGHAKVVIELLRAAGYEVAFCIGAPDSNDICMGIPVLHGDEHLQSLRKNGYTLAFVAVGSNRLRKKLSAEVSDFGFTLVNAISPAATLSSSIRIGRGVAIMAGVVINADTRIGDGAIINTGAIIDHDGHVADYTHIAPQCALAGNVTIHTGAMLGVGCKVIPHVEIGEDSVVGAGAVVIHSIPARVTAVGVPAIIKNTPKQ